MLYYRLSLETGCQNHLRSLLFDYDEKLPLARENMFISKHKNGGFDMCGTCKMYSMT